MWRATADRRPARARVALVIAARRASESGHAPTRTSDFVLPGDLTCDTAPPIGARLLRRRAPLRRPPCRADDDPDRTTPLPWRASLVGAQHPCPARRPDLRRPRRRRDAVRVPAA